jgi:phosphate starvation-inducible protein PhoH
MALLQGLLDTDGTVDKGGHVYFCTTSQSLSQQFKILVQSLGMDCKVVDKIKKFNYKGKIKEGRIAYNCTVYTNDATDLFRLARKKAMAKPRTKYFIKRIIDRVEYVGEKECQCIMIDHPEHLYLTNNFIPTHNTHLAVAFAIEQLLSKKKKKIIITRPIVEAGESLGYLPGEFTDKVYPYMLPIYDCIDRLVGRENGLRERVDACLEVAPLAYLRGRTFHDAVCILDEAQNATKMQLKMFLTRFGENSKVVVTGDPTQSDLGGVIALMDVMHRLQGITGIGVVQFKANSIVRHPLVGEILKHLEI